MGRDKDELKHEYESALQCVTKELDVTKGRAALLGEMTEALEVAIKEKQRALDEKEDIVTETNKLWNDHQALLSAKNATQRALEAARAEQGQHKELMREHTLLQSRHKELMRAHG